MKITEARCGNYNFADTTAASLLDESASGGAARTSEYRDSYLNKSENMDPIEEKNQRVPALAVNLQQGCRELFIALMKEHGVEYTEMPSGSGVCFVGVFRDGNLWATTLTTAISVFLNGKPRHKVIATTRSMAVINCEGLSAAEITNLLLFARFLVVVDMDSIYQSNENECATEGANKS